MKTQKPVKNMIFKTKSRYFNPRMTPWIYQRVFDFSSSKIRTHNEQKRVKKHLILKAKNSFSNRNGFLNTSKLQIFKAEILFSNRKFCTQTMTKFVYTFEI